MRHVKRFLGSIHLVVSHSEKSFKCKLKYDQSFTLKLQITTQIRVTDTCTLPKYNEVLDKGLTRHSEGKGLPIMEGTTP